LHELGFKRGGFFVEFGASNGVDLSNTLLLERDYGWSGILAEPAVCWHDSLTKNRRAKIEKRCVWSRTGQRLSFQEVHAAELSTIASFASTDMHLQSRKEGRSYSVDTISLLDMLDAHSAPPEIDYLSIDTEGSELDILSTFDFQRYRFGVITVEHNYGATREPIHQLLTSNGYERKFAEVSLFDDWYVRKKTA
jgi:FkbM family methyltransferase